MKKYRVRVTITREADYMEYGNTPEEACAHAIESAESDFGCDAEITATESEVMVDDYI